MFRNIRKGKKVVEDIKNIIKLFKELNNHFTLEENLSREEYNELLAEVNLYERE